MISRIPHVLPSEQLRALLQALEQGEFVDGKLTAGAFIQSAKHNLQLTRAESVQPLEAIVSNALGRSLDFNRATLPKTMTPPMFSRYESGMNYGRHVDEPLMGGRLRSDLSVTVFLTPPDAYDGGELCIESDVGVEKVKLPAGDAIVYPATTIHWVTPVTRGLRVVAIVWVQSLVRDHAMRRIVRDIAVVIDGLAQSDARSHEVELLTRAYANLVRLVAEI